MSTSSERLSDLLLQWKELQQQGKEVTPEEICADHPELLEELRRRIRVIRTMEQMLGTSPSSSSMTTQAAGRPGAGGTLPESARADLEKIHIPGYELLGVLDRGGMGVVYKAVQTQLKRTVALKMILGGAHAGPQQLTRFRTEAEAIARLQHPHIVQIYDVGESEGKPFFTMEFVAGGNLAQNLEAYRLPPGSGSSKSAPTRSGDRKDRQERVDRIAHLVETLARTIHVAHERGIVHRDLKPANILLTPDGTPKITDFGLAKRLDTSASKQTNTGAILGTPSYMAPEQASGKTRAIGPGTDIYALGAILYELLTGRPPFQGETSIETLMGVMSEDAVPPSRLQRSVPRNLEAICMKCLEKKPTHRYLSAAELADDLHRFRNDLPINARQMGPFRRASRWLRRHPIVTLVAVFIAIGGIAFATVRRQGEDPRVEAERLAPEVRRLMKNYCFECHGLDPVLMGRDLNVLDYDALFKESRPQVVAGKPQDSRLLKRLIDDTMPPKNGDGEEMPRLSLDQQQLIARWILGGAPRFAPIGPEDMEPLAVESTPLSAQVKQIFAQKCRACHNPEEPGGGIRILNHDTLVNKHKVVVPRDPAASELFRLITYEQDPVMPPRDKGDDGKVTDNRLTTEEVATIREWIAAGAAEFPRNKKKAH